jgi:hypothetical protein
MGMAERHRTWESEWDMGIRMAWQPTPYRLNSSKDYCFLFQQPSRIIDQFGCEVFTKIRFNS